jgi:predicted nucleic acid-binding protein
VASEIFVDSGAWIAISDHCDKYHEKASSFYWDLIKERRSLITTNLVTAETYIIIRRMGGIKPALQFLQSLREAPGLRKVYSDADMEKQAEAILMKYDDRDFSFTDAVSFALMRERGIEEAFAFDGRFVTAGFQIMPGE